MIIGDVSTTNVRINRILLNFSLSVLIQWNVSHKVTVLLMLKHYMDQYNISVIGSTYMKIRSKEYLC